MSQKVDMRILKSFQGKLMATIMSATQNTEGNKAKKVALGEKGRTEGRGLG